jgi:hypothetical protein
MGNPVILIHIGDREWTLQALRSACLLARRTSASIALVKMIPIRHHRWLGTDMGDVNYTVREQRHFARCQAIVEGQGIACTPLLFQYVTLTEAIVQAVEHVHAQVVFIQLPDSGVPFWRRFQLWSLNRRLVRQHCQLVQHPVEGSSLQRLAAELVRAA